MRRTSRSSGPRKVKEGALRMAFSLCAHGSQKVQTSNRPSDKESSPMHNGATPTGTPTNSSSMAHALETNQDTDESGSRRSSMMQPCASPSNNNNNNLGDDDGTAGAESDALDPPTELCTKAQPQQAQAAGQPHASMASEVARDNALRKNNPLLRFHQMPLAKQFRHMEREFTYLEYTTMDPTQYDFTTSQRQMMLNRYINVMANEHTIFPSRQCVGGVTAATTANTSPSYSTNGADRKGQEQGGGARMTLQMTPELTPPLEPPLPYINGNVIDLGVKPVFVACQAPPPNVIGAFLTTLYDHRVRLVVMLTSLTENGIPKADRYWPEDDHASAKEECYDDKSVRIAKDPERPYEYDSSLGLTWRPLLLYRRLRPVRGTRDTNTTADVAQESDSEDEAVVWSAAHRVLQVQYTGWPDQGVPHTTVAFEALLQLLREHARGDGSDAQTSADCGDRSATEQPPVVVHCSAGIGRTGTLIGAYAAVALLEQGRMTNTTIMDLVAAMRQARFGMVQRVEQYFFIYQIVLHYIGVDVTDFADMLQDKVEEFRLQMCTARDQRALDRMRLGLLGGGSGAASRGRPSPKSSLGNACGGASSKSSSRTGK